METSLKEAWAKIVNHTAQNKAYKQIKDTQQNEINALWTELQTTKLLVETEKENNIALELEILEYKRRGRRGLLLIGSSRNAR